MRDMSLLPPPVEFSTTPENAALVRYLDVQFKRIEQYLRGEYLTGSSGGAGGPGVVISPGIELYQPGDTPYIDFHSAANPAGDADADFLWRIIMADDFHLEFQNPPYTPKFQFWNDGNFHATAIGLGAGVLAADNPWNKGIRINQVAADNQDGLHFNNVVTDKKIVFWDPDYYMGIRGGTLLFSSNNIYEFLKGGGADPRLSLNDCVILLRGPNDFNHMLRYRTDDFDIYRSNSGFKVQTAGSSDKLSVFTGSVEAHAPIFGEDGMLCNWNNSSGHGIASERSAGDTRGYMTRNDGTMWIMFNTQVNWRQFDGQEFYQFNAHGDVRFNVPTVAPGDPDLRIAGSSQLLRNASQRKYKKDIIDLEKENNPVFRMRPVRYHWKDDVREHGARFNARHPRGCPGFIAEELHEVAADSVSVDYDDNPVAPDTWALFAYVVAGLQEINDRMKVLESNGQS